MRIGGRAVAEARRSARASARAGSISGALAGPRQAISQPAGCMCISGPSAAGRGGGVWRGCGGMSISGAR